METMNVEYAMDGYYSEVGATVPELQVGDLVLVAAARYDPNSDINSFMQLFFVIAKALPIVNSQTKELVLDGKE